MAWAPNGQAIALTMEEKSGPSNRDVPGIRVLMVTVPEGRWTELDGIDGYEYVVNWSPDGRWVSYDSEDWIKIRPEGVLWELEIDAYLQQMDQRNQKGSNS